MTQRLDLLPVGVVEDEVLIVLEQRLHQMLEWEVRRIPPMPLPAAAFHEARKQYDALQVMRAVADAAPADATRVLGILEPDLSIPILTFVFGQAQLRGRIALMSLARLRQEFYGSPANRKLMELRAMKEALHELGHTFGLVHCPVPSCIMTLANDIQHVDRKNIEFCGGCAVLFTDARRAAETNAEKELL